MSANSVATQEGNRLEGPESEGEVAGCLTAESYRSITRDGRGSGIHRYSRGHNVPVRESQRRPVIRVRDEGRSGRSVNGQKQTFPSIVDDERARFYRTYRNEAEEYDREFINRYNEDLNNTLIFAGLFSAVTSAFITQAQPQLQQDPNGETAALLRVLINKIDNATFGDNPQVPQWSGPSATVVQALAILYASLVVSLFSAFLAMLGKQWLNRYASVDTRGSPIERNQNRQRKLDGTVAWYFGYAMESLPLMLQGALFLLGCALSIYLRGINTTIYSVVFGVTVFSAGFYGAVVVAGTISADCPYQTPYARLFRYIIHNILPFVPAMLNSAASSITNGSRSIAVAVIFLRGLQWPRVDCACVVNFFFMFPIYFIIFPIYFFVLPTLMVYDACLLTLAIFRAFRNLARRVRSWFLSTSKPASKAAILDTKCISWMLRASMDKTVHLSGLHFLATMTTLVDFSPALISACFDILIGCVMVVDGKVVVTQESEELADVSAHCCLRTLSHLAATDPTLRTIKHVQRQYTKAFPPTTSFHTLPLDHSLRTIHDIFYSLRPKIQWGGYRILGEDQVILAHTLAELAQRHTSEAMQNSLEVFLWGEQRVKVPRWILRYALHHLAQDPLPPASVVIDCLSIIAIDLGCSGALGSSVQDESGRLEEISSLVANTLLTMAQSDGTSKLQSKRKAITAFFPYAVRREHEEFKMMEAFLGAVRAFGSGASLWHTIVPFISTLFSVASDTTIVLTSPHVSWHHKLVNKSAAEKWVTAASASDPEEVGQEVVEALLHIASVDSLQSCIPNDTWQWLTRRPTLPPVCIGRALGTKIHVIRRVQDLRDAEILTSYFILVWSEWDPIPRECLSQMKLAISPDSRGGEGRGLRGEEGRDHRNDLVKRLEHVLSELDRGLGYFKQQKLWIDEGHVLQAKQQYGELKEILIGMDTTDGGPDNVIQPEV